MATKKTSTSSKSSSKSTSKSSSSKTSESTSEKSTKKSASKYSVGDKVVHPQHGAATISKKIKQEFAGEKKDYFVLDIATEQLTVKVPVEAIDDLIRPIISKTQARKVLAVLKEEPQEAGSNWSRWYKVLTEKMYSGDIFQVAEVVRDLNYAQQTKGISPALKRMLSKARVTLTSELEFSLGIDEEEAVKKLDRALPVFEVPED
ncbi:MAG: CarD family transcriptional regulator [Acidimicrobiia bacterium]|nr:CarD family transcriptional regulator [Acidimicrobiia bacterium]